MITRISKYKSILATLVLALMLLAPFISPAAVYAATNYITDDAGLLTDTEQTDLNSQIQTFTKNNGYSIYFYTVNNTNGLSNSIYLSDQADSLAIDDGILVLVNMEPGNREIKIQSYGSIQKDHFPAERLQKITDSIKGYFTDKQYKKGFDRCLSMLSVYSKSSTKTDGLFFRSWLQAIIAIVIGLVVVGIMAINSGGKVTTSQATYLNPQTSKLLGRYDHYIRTSYIRTKRESDSNHDGGSSGYSSGGRSYSEGSSKF